MQKKIVAAVALVFLSSFGGYLMAQPQGGPVSGQSETHHPGQGTPGQKPMDPGMGMMGERGQGMGMMGGMMGSGMMCPMMSSGMMGQMGAGMGMMSGMSGMMGSPEIMGAMMSIHGEMMSLRGRMMQEFGAMDQMSPEDQKKMRSEMMDRMGEILTQHGTALKEKAKALGK